LHIAPIQQTLLRETRKVNAALMIIVLAFVLEHTVRADLAAPLQCADEDDRRENRGLAVD
jgi:hypothetical protein